MSLDVTEHFELPLPHPDNSPRTVDVPRLRAALTAIDELIKELQDQAEDLNEGKADKSQVAIDIANAVSAAVSDLLAGAPEAYDTLKEIADKLADNDDVAGNILLLISALQIGKADLVSGKVPLTQLSISSDEDAEAGTGTGLMDATKTAKAIAAQALNTLPVGTIIQAMEHPGEGWLALDGSKYLRSAYPEIEGLFGVPLVANSSTIITNRPQAVVSGGYLISLSTAGDDKIYRAPVTATTIGEFSEVHTIPGSSGNIRLTASKEGRVYALRAYTSTSSYLVRSDDHGETWETIATFIPSTGFSTLSYLDVFEVGESIILCSDQRIFRLSGGAITATSMGGSYYPCVELDGLIYFVNASNATINAYDPATATMVTSLRRTIPLGANAGDAVQIFKYRGDLAIARFDGQHLQAYSVPANGRSHLLTHVYLYNLSYNYYFTNLYSIDAQDKGGVIEAIFLAKNNTANRTIGVSIDVDSGVITTLDLGYYEGTFARKATRSGNVMVLPIASESHLAKVVLDTDSDTEFRVPNRPNHYIKAEAA